MDPVLDIHRSNAILYCDRWDETVRFYRDLLGFHVTHAADWFVEVHLHDAAHLSLADASRATIGPAHGAGLTLSWQVPDVLAARARLVEIGVAVSEVATRWNDPYAELHDPEGTRIELWSTAEGC